jgi:hypothetical protein
VEEEAGSLAASEEPSRSESTGPEDADSMDQQVKMLVEALLRRGIDDRTFRGDLTVEELGFVLGQLLQGAARLAAEHQAGVEKAAALVTSVFLHGTENRQDATAKDRAIRPHARAEPDEHSNLKDGKSQGRTEARR